jgi:hypothetical protein
MQLDLLRLLGVAARQSASAATVSTHNYFRLRPCNLKNLFSVPDSFLELKVERSWGSLYIDPLHEVLEAHLNL